nr:MAG TPA: hypothetical protein [Bacteriophage sp.]
MITPCYIDTVIHSFLPTTGIGGDFLLLRLMLG